MHGWCAVTCPGEEAVAEKCCHKPQCGGQPHHHGWRCRDLCHGKYLAHNAYDRHAKRCCGEKGRHAGESQGAAKQVPWLVQEEQCHKHREVEGEPHILFCPLRSRVDARGMSREFNPPIVVHEDAYGTQ